MTRWFYAACAASLLVCSAASADEGMWPFHGFPFAKANARLARVEQIKSFRILHEELSPETGVMTPTRKKRRKQLMERYKPLIDTLYDDSEEQLIKEQVGS